MRATLPLLGLMLVALAARADACAVCAGGDNAQLAAASNSVVWALLALVGFIFLATAATIYFIWRRANTPIPPHVQFIESLNTADAAD
jgi:hypothetical protein